MHAHDAIRLEFRPPWRAANVCIILAYNQDYAYYLAMTTGKRVSGVPRGALIAPTLMLTGRSAAAVYAQPAPELNRLAETGAIFKIARGYYAAVPIGVQVGDWLPSTEDLTAGLANAIYGPGGGALWGLSAARVHGAFPRALATGYALGPTQHRPIALTARPGTVQFSKRDPHRLDLQFHATPLGPALVTSVAQTILDLSRPSMSGDATRVEAVRSLMKMVDADALADLADRVRGQSALNRARKLVVHASQ